MRLWVRVPLLRKTQSRFIWSGVRGLYVWSQAVSIEVGRFVTACVKTSVASSLQAAVTSYLQVLLPANADLRVVG